MILFTKEELVSCDKITKLELEDFFKMKLSQIVEGLPFGGPVLEHCTVFNL